MKINKVLVASIAAVGALVVPELAMAAYDTAPVVTAVGEAEVAGMAVGTKVVAVVAGFVVIGVIIAMVKKV